MVRYLQVLHISVLLLWTSFLFAGSPTNKCVSAEIKTLNKELILPGPDQAHTAKIYIFKNITAKSIWIDHPVPHPSVSAGWSSYLRANHAAALLVNRKNFVINCALIIPGKVEYLDCSKVVTTCTAENAVLPATLKGTFWLAEDKSWEDLLKALAKRGVLFSSPFSLK